MDGNCHEAVPISFFDATRRNIGEISLYSAQFALTLHPNNIN
jgi:hypothetical protein